MIQELLQQKAMLLKEYEYEKELFQRQTENMGIKRKVRQGLCWYPLYVGRSYFNSMDQLVIEVERTDALDIDHQFEPAKPVCFFEEDASGMLYYMKFVAQVSFVDGDRMVIALPSNDALERVKAANRLGVQLYLDEYTYHLMFDALDRVISAHDGRLAELRDICHTDMPIRKYKLLPVRFPWLNPSQEAAVNEVLCAKDVAVVHGPPGTGKTTTLVEAIYETLRREVQVLVCAQSNMAVDWIAEKLTDRGVNVLRIGNPSRVTDKMLGDTYERRFEAHPSYTQLWSIRRAIRELYESGSSNREGRHQKIARLKERATELEYEINESLFSEARVIACTLTGSASHLLMGHHFGTLFIDEAAQAMEAACWIAVQKADRIILAGDHRQLPPTIKCPEAMAGGLDHTLMQQIVEKKPKAVSLLTVQYRMTDAIMQFPNHEFYGGQLRSDPSVKNRSILDWDSAIEWVSPDISPSQEDFSGESDYGLSKQNPEEARQTMETLKQYILKIGKERFLEERIDVGMISPYKGQVYLLRHLLKHDAFWKPFRSLITINTVDGFQGQERDIIVISMVRSNEEGQVGFLRDLRRMNVAITRARMKLIIVGDRDTLFRHPFYRRLYQYIFHNKDMENEEWRKRMENQVATGVDQSSITNS